MQVQGADHIIRDNQRGRVDKVSQRCHTGEGCAKKFLVLFECPSWGIRKKVKNIEVFNITFQKQATLDLCPSVVSA